MNLVDRLMAMLWRRPDRSDGGPDEDRARRVREALAEAERARQMVRRLEMEARVFAGSPRRRDDEP